MAPATLIRWSGLSLVAGGACYALFLLLHPYGEVAGAHVAHDSLWIPAHSMHFLGAVFTLFGLLGLYAKWWGKLGRVGFAAWVLSFIGTAMFVGTGMITAALWPAIAEDYPEFVEAEGGMFEDPLTAGITTATYVFMCLGFIPLAFVLWRQRVLPWPTATLMVVGILLFSAPVDPVGPAPWIARFSGAIIFGAALAWTGLIAWRDSELPGAEDAQGESHAGPPEPSPTVAR